MASFDDEKTYVKRRKNHIWIERDIDNDVLTDFTQSLIDLEISAGILEETYTPVTVHITSYGGDAFSSLAIYDRLKAYPGEVTTIVEGVAASGGSIILMAGKNRYIRPSGYILIHPIHTFFYGSYERLRDEVKLMEKMMERVAEIYQSGSKLTLPKIKALLERDTWLNAQEAQEMGFAEIVNR